MTQRLLRSLFCAGLVALPGFGGSADAVQHFALTGTEGLVEHRVTVKAAEYKGRKAVRLTKESFGDGCALVQGTDFQDGTIQVDLAVRVTPAPPGGRNPGFLGIAFRVRPDVSHYELFYIRPGNSQSIDQAMRNHATQYSSAPDFDWYRLRRAWPSVYEAYSELEPEAWTQVKIEVAGRSASLFLNGSAKPSLVVDGLKGEDLRGSIALWGSPGEESYFSNLRITPAAPRAVKNGGEAAGVWEVKSSTDAGSVDGKLQLKRTGNQLTGTWSGELGVDQVVRGTWRDGYIELTSLGVWPKDRDGAAGNVTFTFAGWIDGQSASGRMKVEGRADGRWSARRGK